MTVLLRDMFVVLAISVLSFPRAKGHGYMTGPRSRNLLAFQETVWWPVTETDPQPETCPHCLNRGGSLAQCGISQEMRNYDAPLNALGSPMPINLQATYLQGEEIVIDVTLTAHHKGHFEFAACAISEGEMPTKECFEQNKLTFVEDLIYGANYDANHPHRAYIAPVNVVVDGTYVPDYGTTEGLMDFKFKMRLPESVYGDLVLIQWYYLTANSCIHDGYAEYNWPEGWRDSSMSASLCGDVSADGDGAPEQFWNCAETRILANTNTVQTSTSTNGQTKQPTNPPIAEVQSATVAIPVSNIDASSLAETTKISSSHGKLIVGYYASWQWYDRNKLAAPSNMDFTKLQRVNYAFFQTDTSGNIWGTDSWGDPNVLFGPYDWNPSDSSKEFCSWDSPTDRPCNYHKYEEGLIHLVHAAGAELYPSLGGWTLSDPFPAMAADPTARANFAKNCVELIKAYDFDGIDIDWEYPGFEEHSGTPNDKESFSLLLDEVRSQLDQLGAETGRFYGLTAALPCGPQHIANMDVAHVAATLSHLNLMTYDFHGAFSATTGTNAPLYYQGWGEEGFSVHDCVANWLAGGATKNKINIGLPFYGRSFATATELNAPHDGADQVVWGIDDGTPQYFNIMAQLPSMTHIWDKQSWTDWAYFESGGSVSFDGEDAICAKTQFAIENELAGFIIWELSGDVMSDLSTPLLDTVNNKLSDPSHSCGEPGYYPEEVPIDASSSVAANNDATDSWTETSPSSPISGSSPTYNTEPSAYTPSSSTVLSTPSTSGEQSTNGSPPTSNLPVLANPDNPDSTALLLSCGENKSKADPKPLGLSFKYELHRHPFVTSTSAMEDAKATMLQDIAKHFECQDASLSSGRRRLSNLRNSDTESIRDYVVAFMSPPSDMPGNYPCTVPVALDSASVCDSMIGSLTVFIASDASESVERDVWQEIIFTIRTGMAAGRYETSQVLKAIFIEDTTANQLQSSQSSTSASMVTWTPETEGVSASTIIVVVVCVLLIVATMVIQIVFFKRSRASDVSRDNEESLASSVSHLEEVWKKALDTYDTTRSGIDPIGEYVVTGTTKTSSSDNLSDIGHEVEITHNVVKNDENSKAKGHKDPPDSSPGIAAQETYNADIHDPPEGQDDASAISGEDNSSLGSEWSDLSSMEIFELKTELEIHGVNCSGMIERIEYVRAVKAARRRKAAIESGDI